ncbi:MAG: PpiC-type peptidyl-prolyl cis-trans isomerase [Microgenomates group bacterium GW2011_GWA2_44_7]|nr:MAG: PpiC-type peptidyl-prolyl cis-trans isomerase [Microgenomates group bacterium GW2011_GWA2_44_7]KKT78221.1 MAG: PpiC-type peptidyl-prolyl cis-trans isomerase [Microgenomates group bacterium GW2011_GWB1_44_8]
MPQKKGKNSKTVNKAKKTERVESATFEPDRALDTISPVAPKGLSLKSKLAIVAVLALLIAFGLWKKEWFVVAVVNGQPVTRWQLNQILVKQYGAQTLDNLINQQIAQQEVAKQGGSVTDKEVDDRINQISATVPQGMTLDQALQAQGLDKEEFKKQIKLQLSIDKILASKITVSEKEINDYIASNASQFKGVPSDTAKETAKKTLEQQKGSTEFSSWFNSLKQSAKVLKFI